MNPYGNKQLLPSQNTNSALTLVLLKKNENFNIIMVKNTTNFIL